MIRKKLKEYQKRFKKAMSEQDGKCTLWPEKIFGIKLTPCCKVHDYACADARARRSERKRLEGDRDLRNCANKSFPLMGEVMYSGIRGWLNVRKKLFGTSMY